MRALVLAAVLLLLGAAQAAAAGIVVRAPWIRTPPAGAQTAAAYCTITNHGAATDRLKGGSSTAAASVTVHETLRSGGIVRMREVPSLPIGASATVKLEPNGYHLMLTSPRAPLKAGQHVRIVLHFERAGDVPVDFIVAAGQGGGMGGMRMP